jgi:alpha-N-arabinofuranosidase
MKKIDPSIRIAVCGSAGYGTTGIGLPWNRVLIQRCARLVDYLSIHHYEGPARYAEGPRAYEEFFRKTGELITASENSQLKIFVSEWNAQSTDWRTGLYAGGLLCGFERCGDVVEIGSPALFLRHVSATGWDNAFVNFDHRTWFPAPNYVVMQLWRDHWAPQRIEMSGQEGSLNAVASKSADGAIIIWKAVNPSDQTVPVELRIQDGFVPGQVQAQLVAPDSLEARNTLDNPRAVKAAAAQVETAGQTVRLTLPRWSAAVVEIKKK